MITDNNDPAQYLKAELELFRTERNCQTTAFFAADINAPAAMSFAVTVAV